MSKKKELICTYCHTPIEDIIDNLVLCNGCGLPYHKECWQELDVCATYGCNSNKCHGIFDVDFTKHITNNDFIEINFEEENNNELENSNSINDSQQNLDISNQTNHQYNFIDYLKDIPVFFKRGKELIIGLLIFTFIICLIGFSIK